MNFTELVNATVHIGDITFVHCNMSEQDEEYVEILKENAISININKGYIFLDFGDVCVFLHLS